MRRGGNTLLSVGGGNGIGPITLAGAAGQVQTFGPGVLPASSRGAFGYMINDGFKYWSMLAHGSTGVFQIISQATGHTYISCTIDDTVKLFFGGALKLETLTGGVKVTGDLDATVSIHSIAVGDILSKSVAETVSGEWTYSGGIKLGSGYLQLPITTTAALEAIGNAVNTNANKIFGTVYGNSDTGKIVVAAGSADGDVWTDTVANTLHTPI